MTYTYNPANADNIISLDEQGMVVASPVGSRILVGLQDIPLTKLRRLWVDFQEELRSAIHDALAKSPADFSKWHIYNLKYNFDSNVIKTDSCIGFKKLAAGGPKLHYLRQRPVIEALIDLKLILPTNPQGRRRKKAVKGETISGVCQDLSTEEQRSVLREIFAADQSSLDDIFYISQSAVVNCGAVEELLEQASDSHAFLTLLAEALWAFDTEQQNQATGGKGAGRQYAAPWFCVWLAREGHVLLPRLHNSEFLLPRLLTPFFWTFFAPRPARDIAAHLVSHVGETQWQYSYSAFRDLLLSTNFFRQNPTKITLAPFLRLKAEYTTSEHVADRVKSGSLRSHGINRLCDAYLAFHGKTWEDIGPDARYFGGGKKITSNRGREPFDWVEHPRGRKLNLYRELVGEPPDEFPDFIQEWARDLRSILPMFGVQDPEGKIDTLNHWLLYLIKLGEEAPRNWLEIDREIHINHLGHGTSLTFVDFLKGHKKGGGQKVISDLQKAWHLVATRDRFLSAVRCPIDFKIDHVGWGSSKGDFGRTRRKSVPQQIHSIILDEHRRDGFAFARSLVWGEGQRQGERIHYRTVLDPVFQERVEVFWPGVPMILDVILSMGTLSRDYA